MRTKKNKAKREHVIWVQEKEPYWHLQNDAVSSIAKRTPPSGALKTAETPAAVPAKTKTKHKSIDTKQPNRKRERLSQINCVHENQ
jgi:hypothetical protein